jgi:hypothetical protein
MRLPWAQQVEANAFRDKWDADATRSRWSVLPFRGSKQEADHQAGKNVPSAKGGSKSTSKK